MKIALCLALLSLALPARATLLYGEVEAVANDWSYWDVLAGDPVVPFGLQADSLEGTRATFRFWISTDALPADYEPAPGISSYRTLPTETEWLWMEIEINGVTARPRPDDSQLIIREEAAHAQADLFGFGVGRYEPYTLGTEILAEGLNLNITGSDLGPSGVIPQSFELTTFPSFRNANIYGLNLWELDPETDELTMGARLNLDFDLISARMYPVPEPVAVTPLASLALLIVVVTRARARLSHPARFPGPPSSA